MLEIPCRKIESGQWVSVATVHNPHIDTHEDGKPRKPRSVAVFMVSNVNDTNVCRLILK